MILKYHHIGIPSRESRPGETYLPKFKVFVVGFEQSSFGVEWMRFEPDSPVHQLIREVPHVAFQVEDLEAALDGKEVLVEPNSPSPGVRVAFIVEGGAPIEFLEFKE